jgi:hypothetical protein
VVFYKEAEGDVPVLDWLKRLRRSDQLAYAKCIASIERLAEFGHELRRPLADFLRDGIHELRIRKGAGELSNSVLLPWKGSGGSDTCDYQGG